MFPGDGSRRVARWHCPLKSHAHTRPTATLSAQGPCCQQKTSRAKPPRRGPSAAPHRATAHAHTPWSTGTAQLTRDKTTPRMTLSPTINHSPHTQVNSNPSARPPLTRRQSPGRPRRRGDLHRDGDALHHKRRVFARRPRGLRLVLAVRQLVGARLSRALE